MTQIHRASANAYMSIETMANRVLKHRYSTTYFSKVYNQPASEICLVNTFTKTALKKRFTQNLRKILSSFTKVVTNSDAHDQTVLGQHLIP